MKPVRFLLPLAIVTSCGGKPGPAEPATGSLPIYSQNTAREGSSIDQNSDDPVGNQGATLGQSGGAANVSLANSASPGVSEGGGQVALDGDNSNGNSANSDAAGDNSSVSVGEGLPAPSSNLPRSTPEAQGVDPAGILALVNALDQQIDEVHSLMLVRHGTVVAEGFWAPYEPQDVHVLYSVSKSFNATAVGLAQQEGLLSITDTVLSHFSDLAPVAPAEQFETMQLRDLLMMASGHQADTMDTLRARNDGQWSRAFLETQVQNQPGTNFVYNSGASYMLASAVQRATGQTVLEYLGTRLFEPLGIGAGIWGESPEGVALAGGGVGFAHGRLGKVWAVVFAGRSVERRAGSRCSMGCGGHELPDLNGQQRW